MDRHRGRPGRVDRRLRLDDVRLVSWPGHDRDVGVGEVAEHDVLERDRAARSGVDDDVGAHLARCRDECGPACEDALGNLDDVGADAEIGDDVVPECPREDESVGTGKAGEAIVAYAAA